MASVNTVLSAAQTDEAPEIGAGDVLPIFKLAVATQDPIVYERMVVPVAVPELKVPEEEPIVPTVVGEFVHVPPLTAFVNVYDDSVQIAAGAAPNDTPVIIAGDVLTVTAFVRGAPQPLA